jgi:AraC family transcriptional regulator
MPNVCTRRPRDFRVTLHSSDLLLLEDHSAAADQEPVMVAEHYQVQFPYCGLVVLSSGSTRWVLDSNSVLFTPPWKEFRVEHPVADVGHAALVVTPSRQALEEVCGAHGVSWNSAFKYVSRASSSCLNLLIQRLRAHAPAGDRLWIDECTVHALQLAFVESPLPCGPPSRAVARAKEVLQARSCERLSLNEIAREVGVAPVYLTQEFTRTEGIPLYRYQLRLRLNRALLALPHCEDITGLALDLGFSSHSHFTAVFRRSFGLTPSEYRASASLAGSGAARLQLHGCTGIGERRAA